MRLLGFGIILAVISIRTLLRYPRVREPVLLEECLRRALERDKGQTDGARDPCKNAYLSPAFLTYWGVKKDRLPDSHTENTVREWLQICALRSKSERLASLETSEFIRKRREFIRLASELGEELKKAIFLVPGDLAVRFEESLNIDNLSLLMKGLLKLAEDQVQRRDFKSASLTLVTAINLGHSIQTGGNYLDVLAGKSFLRDFNLKFVNLLSTSELQANDWGDVLSALLTTLTPEDGLCIWLEDLIAAGRIGHRFPRRSSERSSPISGVDFLGLLGIRAREERIYCNLMADVLKAARAGEKLRTLERGDVGFFTIVPSQFQLDMMTHLYHLCRQEFLGLILTLSLLEFRAKHECFPEKLSVLDLPTNLTGIVWNHPEKRLTVPIDRNRILNDWLFIADEEYSGSTWVSVVNRKELVYELN